MSNISKREHSVEAPTTASQSFLGRMKGAALLDIDTYEEVEADTSATGEAAGVVALVAIASAIGASGGGSVAILTAILVSAVGWLIWAGLTYIIGDKMLGGTATWGELLRTIGFAQTPGLLHALNGIPGIPLTFLLGGIPVNGLSVVITVWTALTGLVAIRQALDFGTGKAFLTAILGVVVIVVLKLIF